jgi:hypothetical protein
VNVPVKDNELDGDGVCVLLSVGDRDDDRVE